MNNLTVLAETALEPSIVEAVVPIAALMFGVGAFSWVIEAIANRRRK